MSRPSKKVQPTANPSGEQRRMHSGSVPGVGSMGVPTTSTGPHATNLDTLRKIAEATPAGDWEPRTTGPWHGDHWYVSSGGEHVAMIAAQDGINEDEREPLATHIATFDPPTVLALLTQLEQAEKNADTYQTLYEQRAESLEQAEQQVARVREMAEEMGEGKGFGILTRGREDEYPISYFIEMLEEALDGDTRG